MNNPFEQMECDPEEVTASVGPSLKTDLDAGPKPPLQVRFWLSLKMGIVRKLLHVWLVSLVLSLFVIYGLEGLLASQSTPAIAWWTPKFFIIAGISFACMYLNSAMGMGYGATLIPTLMLLPFKELEPVTIVPTVMMSQFLANIGSGISHQSIGNIDLSKHSPQLKVAMVLSGTGIVGAVIAVNLFVKINSINPTYVTLIIGCAIALVGVVIIATMGRRFRFSWRKIVFLGLAASLIKGFTGGGYSPVVTGGQVLCGVGGKQAVGIKTFPEAVVCLVTVMLFLASGTVHDMSIGYPLVLGAISSMPFSAYTLRQLGAKKVTTLIAGITLFLGGSIIVKVLQAW